jgi:hypothetical protein
MDRYKTRACPFRRAGFENIESEKIITAVCDSKTFNVSQNVLPFRKIEKHKDPLAKGIFRSKVVDIIKRRAAQ